MKILYDYQTFLMQRFGGISRYFVELMNNLPSDFQVDQTTLFTDNVYLIGQKKENHRFFPITLKDFKGKKRFYSIMDKLNTYRCLYTGNYTVFHPTYYDPYFMSAVKKPYVITVYDMIHERFSEMFPKTDRTKEFKRKTILGAEQIIAISNQTKKDLMELYGIDEKKISVVYLGHSVNVTDISPVEGLPKNYILFVGVRQGYKNFERFIQAFSILSGKDSDLHLVCTGHGFTKEEQSMISRLHLEGKVHQFYVSDSQLNYLYQNAQCFVYPSLYEGFGIPILESFASGCPIALSETSCFPEIAQNGGCYFDPYNTDSMVAAISKLIYDTEYRKKQIVNGAEVLHQFSWQKMGMETAEVYKKI